MNRMFKYDYIFRCSYNSSAVLKGPETRPSFTSFIALSKPVIRRRQLGNSICSLIASSLRTFRGCADIIAQSASIVLIFEGKLVVFNESILFFV